MRSGELMYAYRSNTDWRRVACEERRKQLHVHILQANRHLQQVYSQIQIWEQELNGVNDQLFKLTREDTQQDLAAILREKTGPIQPIGSPSPTVRARPKDATDVQDVETVCLPSIPPEEGRRFLQAENQEDQTRVHDTVISAFDLIERCLRRGEEVYKRKPDALHLCVHTMMALIRTRPMSYFSREGQTFYHSKQRGDVLVVLDGSDRYTAWCSARR